MTGGGAHERAPMLKRISTNGSDCIEKFAPEVIDPAVVSASVLSGLCSPSPRLFKCSRDLYRTVEARHALSSRTPRRKPRRAPVSAATVAGSTKTKALP